MDSAISTLDLDDLNAKQLRKLIKGMSIASKPHHEKSDEDKEKDKDEADDENSSKVDLSAEKGDSKPPKVEKDDLPDSLKDDKEDKEDNDDDKKDEEKED